jgi:hypothetical protein
MQFTPSHQLYPFESRWLESSVGRMHYVDEGNGTPILMCHGRLAPVGDRHPASRLAGVAT